MDNFIFCAVQVTVNTFFKHTASLEHTSYAAKLSKAAAFSNDVTTKSKQILIILRLSHIMLTMKMSFLVPFRSFLN